MVPNRKSHGARPDPVEVLEGRSVPSLVLTPGGDPVPVAVAAPGEVQILAATSPAVRPDGRVRVQWQTYGGSSAVGATDSFAGSGVVRGLGRVSLRGAVQRVGPARAARAEGYLTLTGPRGGVTLILHGPVQGEFAPLPGHFDYDLQGGTGAYSGALGRGTVDLATRPGRGPAASGAVLTIRSTAVLS